jgi:hypothetical protein
MVSWDITAKSRNAKTANSERLALITQHLMGASLFVVRKNTLSNLQMKNLESCNLAGSA